MKCPVSVSDGVPRGEISIFQIFKIMAITTENIRGGQILAIYYGEYRRSADFGFWNLGILRDYYGECMESGR